MERTEDGGVVEVTEANAQGELALRPGWPSMFRGYLGAEKRYRTCFARGWYLTGDLAQRDDDGYFWFVGRADDVHQELGSPERPSPALNRELLGFARVHLGAAVAPKEIAFVTSVPHTRSGTIMRRLLKARELGLPEGDLSTMEGAE